MGEQSGAQAGTQNAAKPARLRSLLFVPADNEHRLLKALASAADAIIVDLEDSVAEARKPQARAAVTALLARQAALAKLTHEAQHAPQIWVRVNAWDTRHTLADLAGCVRAGLQGIVLPKAAGGADLLRLGHALDALEAREGLVPGSIGILPVVTETAVAVLGASSFVNASPRLTGMLWGAEDLSADLGASGNRDGDDAFGRWSFVYQHARAQCLLAAVASGVTPIDTLHADYRDEAGLALACAQARRDGFRAKVAIHPSQLDVINRSFTPSAAELAEARSVVEAFAAQPEAGVLGLAGRMVDRPHLERARKILSQAQEGSPAP